MAVDARVVAELLRARQPIEDAAFDQRYDEHVRRMSAVHWTPLAIAARAAALLAPEPGRRVLDVGAGPGELCRVGALGLGGHRTGLEQHQALVSAAIPALT